MLFSGTSIGNQLATFFSQFQQHDRAENASTRLSVFDTLLRRSQQNQVNRFLYQQNVKRLKQVLQAKNESPIDKEHALAEFFKFSRHVSY